MKRMILIITILCFFTEVVVYADIDPTQQREEYIIKDDNSFGDGSVRSGTGGSYGAKTVTGEIREEYTANNGDYSNRQFKDGINLDIFPKVNSRNNNSGINVIGLSNYSKSDELIKKIKMKSGHWTGISLTYNGLISSLRDLSLPADASFMTQSGKSIGISINPFSYTFAFSPRVGLLVGVGFEINNFRFDQNIGLKRENGGIMVDNQYNEKGIPLKKTKLTTSYLNVPLLLEIQFGPKNKWFVNGGVVGGLLLGSHTKIKAKHPELSGKFKQHGGFGLRNFHYGYTVNVGYKHFAITATYYDGLLFRSGKGPELRQANVGFSFLW